MARKYVKSYKDTRPKHMCKDCKFYPKSCGYWNKKFRLDTGISDHFISKDCLNNCKDFQQKIYITEVAMSYCISNKKEKKQTKSKEILISNFKLSKFKEVKL